MPGTFAVSWTFFAAAVSSAQFFGGWTPAFSNQSVRYQMPRTPPYHGTA